MAARSLCKFLISSNKLVLNKAISNNVKFYSANVANYEYIKVEKKGDKSNVGLITINRPKVFNALSEGLMAELTQAIDTFENDNNVAAMVITGDKTAFAAGIILQEIETHTFSRCVSEKLRRSWNKVAQTTKPVIAAVNGYAVGAGLELALMCDIIYAGENAIFTEHAAFLGTVPGNGSTQRLPRAIGKSNAMEMVLSVKEVTVHEAEKMGLVSKICPVDKLLEESIKLGEKIAKNSQIVNALCKEAINTAFETPLTQGIQFENRLFHATFATEDHKEGMNAFLENKRPQNFKNA